MCTVCGHEGPFQPFGIGTQRADALCPVCQSLERHRLMRLALTRLSPLPRPCRLLHFAPEQAMMRFLRPLCDVYITADLMRDDVDHNLNIEDIDLDDASFDAVVCFHVLEHVDDRRALAEIFRVLRPGGLALLAVPIAEGWAQTYENDTVTDAPGRLLHFGQSDHVRWYGRDFRDRVRAAGFTLTEFTADGADAARHALIRGETIFLAHRPAAV
jgi:SAM-dependent methyltransferase